MKKFFAILLTLVLVFGISATAFAENADLTGHAYVAYRIFKGTQAEGENDAELGNIEWGEGVNASNFLDALKANDAFKAENEEHVMVNIFTSCISAKDVAEAIQNANWGEDSKEARAFAALAYDNKTTTSIAVENGVTPADPGYYLIVDVTTFEEGAADTVYNLALLQLTKKGVFEIVSKVDTPAVVKKVKDANDTEETKSEWQDSADYDVLDHVPFQLTATLGKIADYDTYKVVFHDTLSSGLTYDGDNTVVVTIDGTPVTTGFSITSDNGSLTFTFADVKALGAKDNSVITIEYTATLNNNAVVGVPGNPNTVYLEYSNNPNESGSGNTNTGKTPEDKVVVFTYRVVVNKVDENKQPLTGAAFELYKRIPDASQEDGYKWILVDEEVRTDENGALFTWKGIDDGVYKLHESATPSGYNSVADIIFTVSAEHTVLGDEPALTKLNGGDKFTGSIETGELTASIENQKGATLPETGGIGTTIFYIGGGILVLAAVILLITKKRMSV